MKLCTHWDSFTSIQDLIETSISEFFGGIYRKVSTTKSSVVEVIFVSCDWLISARENLKCLIFVP